MQWPGDQKPKNFSQTRQRQSEYYYNFSIIVGFFFIPVSSLKFSAVPFVLRGGGFI